MNKRIEDWKESVDSISIPHELDQVIHQAIDRGLQEEKLAAHQMRRRWFGNKKFQALAITGLILAFAGSAYAMTTYDLFQLRNDKGEVVMELTTNPGDGFDPPSLPEGKFHHEADEESIKNQLNPGEAAVAYFAVDDTVVILQKPFETNNIKEWNQTLEAYNLQVVDGFADEYEFISGRIESVGAIFPAPHLYDGYKQELKEKAKTSNESVAWKVVTDSVIDMPQMRKAVTIYRSSTTEKEIKIIYNMDEFSEKVVISGDKVPIIMKTEVAGKEAYYLDGLSEKQLYWMADRENGPAFKIIISTASSEISQEELVEIANEFVTNP